MLEETAMWANAAAQNGINLGQTPTIFFTAVCFVSGLLYIHLRFMWSIFCVYFKFVLLE